MRKLTLLVFTILSLNIASLQAQNSTFHDAVKSGDLETVETLIENGADVNAIIWYGYTALMTAIENGHTQIAELLIANGVDINETNWFSDSALMIASRNGHTQVVKLLIANGVDVNAVRPVLISAARAELVQR